VRARDIVRDNDGWGSSLKTLHNDGPVSDPFLVVTAQCDFNICNNHENTSVCVRETDLEAFSLALQDVNLIPASFEIQAAPDGERLRLAKHRVTSRRGVDTGVPEEYASSCVEKYCSSVRSICGDKLRVLKGCRCKYKEGGNLVHIKTPSEPPVPGQPTTLMKSV